MEEMLPFGSRDYFGWLTLLLLARGMDFLSTWVGSPNLVLEGNPVSKRLGWSGAMVLNFAVCALLAMWPLPAIIICTISVLLAARNFQLAWAMRASGEENFRNWFVDRLEETPLSLFLFCLLGQTFLVAALGAVLIFFSGVPAGVPQGIGLGMVGYAGAVALYTLASLWRHRRRMRLK